MKTKHIILIIVLVSAVVLASGLVQRLAPKTISLDKKDFFQGEIVKFSIKAKVNLCSNDAPYSIVNENGRVIKISHSCIGFVGSGRDCYCKDGIIDCISVEPSCSDAILCRKEKIDNTFSWDQTEYIEIVEECEGKTIRREEPRQVRPGKYKIVVGNYEKSFSIKNYSKVRLEDFQYEVKGCKGDGYSKNNLVNITVLDNSIEFNQTLITYCNANKDNLKLEYSRQGNTLKINEIFESAMVTKCICSVEIKGRISNLEKGVYKIGFVFDNRYTNQKTKLDTLDFEIK